MGFQLCYEVTTEPGITCYIVAEETLQFQHIKINCIAISMNQWSLKY